MPKNFLITGAARGIGRGLTRHLLASNNRVFLIDHDTTELEHTASVLSKSHSSQVFSTYAADLRSPSAITSAVKEARSFFGGHLDCLVNNAAYTGGVGGLSLQDMTLEEWNKSIETNLTAPMLMTQACLDMLIAARGCVIHVSSTRALMSEPDNEAYSTTKAGLLGLTQSMAVSLGGRGVRVNALVPGWIHVGDECREADEKGGRWKDGLSEEDMRWHLTGRVGRVEDVVRAVEYLVDADGVSGVEMVVDGGVSRKMVYPE
ncbi:short-chain dehydrogenase [Pochonia chlamydosporia 170]|uniref:Short-chain dehydrogenase n=1 Tax=Pochonia chlamydosporia 170 TaxID=1380566 RepID=A0A179F8N7_METCM|nr:short-chain dehydrogenase [Pochonia chlamydosporia 170]OAQ61641.1 short-chain dehydrogenase [Pochonia chlamydosporia 170]